MDEGVFRLISGEKTTKTTFLSQYGENYGFFVVFRRKKLLFFGAISRIFGETAGSVDRFFAHGFDIAALLFLIQASFF